MNTFTFTMGFITTLADFCFWFSESRKWLEREILELLNPEEKPEEIRCDVWHEGNHPEAPYGFKKTKKEGG